MADKEKKKKESVLDLSNLVLDGTIEYMRDPDDQYKLTEDTRQLGRHESHPQPFIQQQDA
ncbi:hypothetical protein J1605_017104 [Eschrichtius robustus]|uniref:Uncharacterized protein n=1 Tax=Eschrichtius robustus TaxID=9764 RepID=A0AB34HZ65_ESCRO|nr:hypothetical protein J1605_017104 [Eschrichtius robustus]